MVEQKITGYENGIVKIEKVERFTISKADVEKAKLELEDRKAKANEAIKTANDELNVIAEKELELAEAEKIIAEAEAQFLTSKTYEQEEMPEVQNFEGGY